MYAITINGDSGFQASKGTQIHYKSTIKMGPYVCYCHKFRTIIKVIVFGMNGPWVLADNKSPEAIR